jgi:hypothetical protein
LLTGGVAHAGASYPHARWGQDRTLSDKPGETAIGCKLIKEFSMEATVGVLLQGRCLCNAVRFEVTDVFDAGCSKLPWLEINDGLPRFSENTITHPRERRSPIVAET